MTYTLRKEPICALIAGALLAACASSPRPPAPTAVTPPAVVGVQAKQLTPEYWISRAPGASRTVLDRRAIAAQNSRMVQLDPSVRDLEELPRTLAAEEVRGWLENLSGYPDEEMWDGEGRKIERSTFDALVDNVALDTLPPTQPTRYGLAVKRGDLRTFPSSQRAYRSADDRDIDRFQESALFPGTPIVLAH